jgi:hypothetical protein
MGYECYESTEMWQIMLEKNVLIYKLLSLWYSVIATQNCPIQSLKLKIGNESINICLKVCKDHQQNSFIIES